MPPPNRSTQPARQANAQPVQPPATLADIPPELRAAARHVAVLISNLQRSVEPLLPAHIKFKDVLACFCNAVIKTPKIAQCTSVSIANALVMSCQSGLIPNGRDAYLVPFWSSYAKAHELTYIPGYLGMIGLMNNDPRVESVSAEVVHEGDDFRVMKGSTPGIHHVPAFMPDAPITHAYAIVRLRNGGVVQEVLPAHEIASIKERSLKKDKESGPWVSDFAAMARKSAVRRVFKFAPSIRSPIFDAIVRADEVADRRMAGDPIPAALTSDMIEDLLKDGGLESLGARAIEAPPSSLQFPGVAGMSDRQKELVEVLRGEFPDAPIERIEMRVRQDEDPEAVRAWLREDEG